MAKTLFMEKLCVDLKLPMIKVVDGASGGGSITTYREQKGTYLPDLELLRWVVCSTLLCSPHVATLIVDTVLLSTASSISVYLNAPLSLVR